MFKNGLVPKSCYFGTMVQLVQESPTPFNVHVPVSHFGSQTNSRINQKSSNFLVFT